MIDSPKESFKVIKYVVKANVCCFRRGELWLRGTPSTQAFSTDKNKNHRLLWYATRDKRSVAEARTLRAGTQSVQALSGRARSKTVGEGRNSRRRYSCYGYIGPCRNAMCCFRRGKAWPSGTPSTQASSTSSRPTHGLEFYFWRCTPFSRATNRLKRTRRLLFPSRTQD